MTQSLVRRCPKCPAAVYPQPLADGKGEALCSAKMQRRVPEPNQLVSFRFSNIRMTKLRREKHAPTDGTPSHFFSWMI